MAKFSTEDALDLAVGPHFRLEDVDPDSTPNFDWDEDDWEEYFHKNDEELGDLQEMLYANYRAEVEGTPSILLVLQGMDTSGKGGIIRHVVSVLDPQGVSISSFGKPTEEELQHDFLWRVEKKLPQPGFIGVFDRSHYEDVLVQRINEMAPAEEIERRYGAIAEWEAKLVQNGTRIIKVMLHISRDFQEENLLERIEREDKHWKYNPDDITERSKWDDYMEAYQVALTRTSTATAPWYCVPSDNKPYARMVVKYLLLNELRALNLSWPEANIDPKEEKERLKNS